MKSVGIIGGLGPETTAEFYLDISFSCQRANKTARPSIVIASVPLPYQIEEDSMLFNKGIERCLPFLITEAQRLERSGVDFVVMPCNSLHVFVEQIRKAIRIPMLSIVEETAVFVKENNFKRIGLVSTSATLRNRVYEEAFNASGIAFEEPNDFQQEKMGKIIHNLVMGQKNNRDRETLLEIIGDFEDKDVDAVALACTDLQLLIPKHPTLKIFDTMKILAEATVRTILS